MNFALPEQFVAAQKSQIDLATSIAQVLFTSAEQFAPLTLDALRGGVQEAASVLGALQSAKTPHDLSSLQSTAGESLLEANTAYSRTVLELAANAHAELSKIFETHAASFQRDLLSSVESAVKNAPAGSESAVAAFKSLFAAAQAGYEAATEAGKQISDATVANVSAATEAGRKAATTGRKSRQAG